jgi:hypothetical protein
VFLAKETPEVTTVRTTGEEEAVPVFTYTEHTIVKNSFVLISKLYILFIVVFVPSGIFGSPKPHTPVHHY